MEDGLVFLTKMERCLIITELSSWGLGKEVEACEYDEDEGCLCGGSPCDSDAVTLEQCAFVRAHKL